MRQLYDKFNYRVWSTGACYNAFDSAVDEDTDVSELKLRYNFFYNCIHHIVDTILE